MARRTVRPRYVRRRSFERSRHSFFRRFLSRESDRLDGTGADRTFTVNASTDIVTSNGHGFETGKGPVVLSSTDTLPAGLAADTFYYPIVLSVNTFQLATSRRNAADGVAVDITDTGTGTHTAVYSTSARAILERLRQGVKFITLQSRTDIDDV